MSAELIREESRYTRTFVWLLHDKARHIHPDYHAIDPHRASLVLDRDAEDRPWEIGEAFIVGTRILVSGKPGLSDEVQYYGWRDGVPDEHTPDWFVALVTDAWELAERERRAALPVALPDPINPALIETGIAVSACQKCPATMDSWTSEDDMPSLYVWQEHHAASTGHRTFHVWRVSRNEARLFSLPA